MVAISNDVDHCMEACLVHYHEELVLVYLIVVFLKEYFQAVKIYVNVQCYCMTLGLFLQFNSEMMRSINRWMQVFVGTT